MIKDRYGLVNCHHDSETDHAYLFGGRIRPYADSLMVQDTGRAACCHAVGLDMVPGTCWEQAQAADFWHLQGLVTKPGCTNKGVMQAQMIIAAQQACTKALSDRIWAEIRRICLLHDESLRFSNVQLWCFVQHNLTEKAYRGIICAAAIC